VRSAPRGSVLCLNQLAEMLTHQRVRVKRAVVSAESASKESKGGKLSHCPFESGVVLHRVSQLGDGVVSPQYVEEIGRRGPVEEANQAERFGTRPGKRGTTAWGGRALLEHSVVAAHHAARVPVRVVFVVERNRGDVVAPRQVAVVTVE
jgi:hypothetical protein